MRAFLEIYTRMPLLRKRPGSKHYLQAEDSMAQEVFPQGGLNLPSILQASISLQDATSFQVTINQNLTANLIRVARFPLLLQHTSAYLDLRSSQYWLCILMTYWLILA